MNKQEFDNFFAMHSQNVDNAEKLGFWALTDDLLKEFLLEQMPNRKDVVLVDFGGGTGRWLQALDEYFENSTLVIVDLSKDMLAQAQKKVDAGVFKNKVQLIHETIEDVASMEAGFADYVISTYNPLSFVEDPQAVINEAHRVLKDGGVAMITVQGYYNALFSKLNNSIADADELLGILKNMQVKWNEYVPALWQLPKSKMRDLFDVAGFKDIEFRGIATVIQPQGEDFDPENKSLGSISKKLNENKAFYDAVYEIEKVASADQDAIDRAMNILTIGRK